MVTTTKRELVTIDEAEALLGVDSSLIKQWIEEGRLAAVPFPTTVLTVNRRDVEELMASSPTALVSEPYVGLRYVTSEEELRRKPSAQEIEARLAAFAAADEDRERLLAARNGELFPPSWEIVRESRDER